jgi:hypothetical protein
MHEASKSEINDIKQAYFLPHHAVIKESSTTTKVQVSYIVYDASAKSSNGKSLNEQLLVGPTVQEDIFSILIRWRMFKIGFTSDIEKMYRQIIMDPNDAKFQRILWRNNPNEEIKQYILDTVTFGTASAPYQATRALIKIADDVNETHPECSKILKLSRYVDDVVSGSHDTKSAQKVCLELSQILAERGLNLRKWSSNSNELLSVIPKEHQEKRNEKDFLKEFIIKALGIQWNPIMDTFSYILQLETNENVETKRQFISNMARLFDPLGWVSPIIIRVKIMAQHLWTRGIEWDDKIPIDINEKWIEIKKELNIINEIKIDRWIQYSPEYKNISIQGFCDASELAYTAVVYIRTETDVINCKLLAAKAKVAPLKKANITTPRTHGSSFINQINNKGFKIH